MQPLALLLRLIVLGIGLGVLAGTSLKLLAPQLASGAAPGTPASKTPGPGPLESQAHALQGSFEARRELTDLSKRWAQLAAGQTKLQASAFLLVLDDGRYAALQADLAMPAASSIKNPILLAALQDLDANKLRWNESLPLTAEVQAGGAGWMANKPLGTSFPVYETATEMIRVSDNSATNLLIKRLGGKELLNARFQTMGLTATAVNTWLPDLNGTNTSSSRDLARSIALVDIGQALSPRSRDLFREIMAESNTNTMIPLGLLQGLGKQDSADPDSDLQERGVRVYNKTGDIGIAYADAALIELPNGHRAVAAFMVKGPFNDPRSANLIRAMAAAMAPKLIQPVNKSATQTAGQPTNQQPSHPNNRPASQPAGQP